MATVIRGGTLSKGRRLLGQENFPASEAGMLSTQSDEAANPSDEQSHLRQSVAEDHARLRTEIETLTAQCEALSIRLESAEEELVSLRNQQEAHWVQSRKAAWDEGFKEGREVGLSEVKAEENRWIETLDKAAQSLEMHRDELFKTVEEMAIELGFAATTKILGSVAIDAEMLANLVRQSIRTKRDDERVKIRMAAADIERLEAYRSAGGKLLNWSQIEWLPDSTLAPGACIVISHAGTLEAGLEQQLQSLKTVLLATREQLPAGGIEHG